MAVPVFRVRGDYLAIVTLGFGEVIQVVANNIVPITNGPLGLKGLAHIPIYGGTGRLHFHPFLRCPPGQFFLWPCNEIHQRRRDGGGSNGHQRILDQDPGFRIQRFFSRCGGRAAGPPDTTISPSLFTFMLTFNLLSMIVIGGLGSTTGAGLGAVLVTWGGESLRAFEEPLTIFGYYYEGIPGMRMVIFSLLLIVLMLFARRGIMGRREFSWQGLIDSSRLIYDRILRRG